MDAEKSEIDSSKMVQCVAKNSAAANELIENNNGFLQRLFKNDLFRLLEDSRLKQAKTELEFRENALRISKEAQLQGLQETYNQYLVKGKGKFRRDRAEFFAEQAVILEQEISQRTEDFIDHMRRMYKRAENIDVDFIREKELKRVENSFQSYMDAMEMLTKSFHDILKEGISI